MALSEEDFQRLQTHLLELKNLNYALEDQCRKQKNGKPDREWQSRSSVHQRPLPALSEVTAKNTVLEQDLAKANKAIQKSKKAGEAQQLMRDNASLQKKLTSQEEDFRIQNQTLLQELTKVGFFYLF